MRDSFLPSLLDRLRDDSTAAAQAAQGVNLETYRAIVLRDVESLLNHPSFFTAHESIASKGDPGVQSKPELFPNVATSVLNYGLDLPGGMLASGQLEQQLAANLKAALEIYEPRLSNIEISLESENETEAEKEQTRLRFRQALFIKAELQAEPFPLDLTIKTQVDIITGRCALEPGN